MNRLSNSNLGLTVIFTCDELNTKVQIYLRDDKDEHAGDDSFGLDPLKLISDHLTMCLREVPLLRVIRLHILSGNVIHSVVDRSQLKSLRVIAHRVIG